VKLTNEFELAAPVERTWPLLLDVPRVGSALPGAQLEPDPDGDSYRGTMKVKLGPVTTEYSGTARLQDVDEDERVASFYVQGREARGQGSASATIVSRVTGHDGGTRVVVETDLHVTGRQAQLGRGLMEDVAGALLDQFASRLERELSGAAEAAAPVPDEPLDVGAVAAQAIGERMLLVLGGLAAGVALGRLLWRRR
jgi:uncharacterized protein